MCVCVCVCVYVCVRACVRVSAIDGRFLGASKREEFGWIVKAAILRHQGIHIA